MGIVYRTTGPWGPGLTEDLTEVQVDYNFWQLAQDVAAKAVQGVGISNFIPNGGEFTVVLTDHTLLGPYPLPIANIRFFGAWLPETVLLANYIITHGGSTYIVLKNHTSAMTFDPGANDGFGNDYYGLLLENPALVVPSGGAVGAFLRKRTTTDYDTSWQTASLTDLTDVLIPTSPGPVDGDIFTFISGLWTPMPLSAMSLLLSGLADVDIPESPGPVTGQVLTWDGSSWSNQLPAFNPSLLTTPVEGQILTFKDGVWQNSNTADIPILSGISTFGTLTLDYSDGSVQRVVMTNGVTLVAVTNWPPAGQFGRLVLEIQNTGAFTWTWPVAYRWPGGAAPVVSTTGRDIFALTTFDGGTNVDGSTIGQNYM